MKNYFRPLSHSGNNYVLDQLKCRQFFTTPDLVSGFHQIRMKDSDIEQTAFSINNGKFEFARMSFGLKNAPAIFQRAIDKELRHWKKKTATFTWIM